MEKIPPVFQTELRHVRTIKEVQRGPNSRKTASYAGQNRGALHYSGEGYHYLQSVVAELAGHTDPTNCGTFELVTEFVRATLRST